jgi:hypothetical protein
MEQWLKRTGKQQCKNTNAPQKETKTMGPNSHMSPSRQKKLKKNASGRSFNPYNAAECLRRKAQLKESQDNHSRAAQMLKIEQLKKRVDFNTRECKKCIKNSGDYKKPHHQTCLYAKAWTPAGKVVLNAMTDWEKQCLNLETKNKYVQCGLLPRSIFENRPPPSRVEPPKTNVLMNPPVDVVTNAPLAAATYDAISVETLESLEATPPPKPPPKESPSLVDSISSIKIKIQGFLFADMTVSVLKKVIPLVIESWGLMKRDERYRAGKCPLPILALLEYIQMQLPFVFEDKENKGAKRLGGGDKRIDWYKKHFPCGRIMWSVPIGGRELGAPPDPLYESIQGTPIFITRWELNVPDLVMSCTECTTGILLNTKFRSSKIASSVTPIFSLSGQTGWQIGSSYACNECSCKVRSTDGTFLCRSLPGWLARSLPVDPKWDNPSNHFQLHRDTAKLIEKVMLTESSGDWTSEILFESQNDLFIELEGAYYTGEVAGIVFADFPFIKDWRGQFPPSGKQIRELAELAAKSINTLSGVSDDERHKRELQGQGCKTSFVLDHTFSALSNYPSQLGAKAICTQGVDGGRISSVVLVDSTAIIEAAHAVEQCARRPNYRPQVMYSDIFPKLHDFFQLIFGVHLLGRLGLFHFMNRILRHMRQDNPSYWAAVRGFKRCIYRFVEEDEDKVIAALKDGTMNGSSHTDEEIRELRDSPKWTSRYGCLMRKFIYPWDTIKANMATWWIEYKVEASEGEPPGKGVLHNGLSMFMPGARAALHAGYESAKYIADVLGNMYNKLEPTPFSKHGISKWVAIRGESSLEKFHHLLAHFGNMGMRRELADSLGFRGTCRYNLKLEWKWAALADRPEEIGDVPSRFRELPCFYDHSALAENNLRAQRCGSPLVRHTKVKLPKPDNGEVFFSEYLLQQRQRNKNVAKHATNSRCQCHLCAQNAVPLPHICDGEDFYSRGVTVVVDEAGESVDIEVVETLPAPLCNTTRNTDIKSMDDFLIYQQLNQVMSMPAAATPVHVFSTMPQQSTTFPFFSQSFFTVEQPPVLPRKLLGKRGREREFQCLCEKERYEQRGRKKPGPTGHSTACKLNKLLHQG